MVTTAFEAMFENTLTAANEWGGLVKLNLYAPLFILYYLRLSEAYKFGQCSSCDVRDKKRSDPIVAVV